MGAMYAMNAMYARCSAGHVSRGVRAPGLPSETCRRQGIVVKKEDPSGAPRKAMISRKGLSCSQSLLVSYMPLAAIFARRFFAARRVLVRYHCVVQRVTRVINHIAAAA